MSALVLFPELVSEASPSAPLAEARGLKVWFPVAQGTVIRRRTGWIRAVDDVSFLIQPGETLGLVGESGSGKSTTGRALLRLIQPTAGQTLFRGIDLARLSGKALREMRQHMQMIYQDPFASLNSRMLIGDSIADGLEIHQIASGSVKHDRVEELLGLVGLDPRLTHRYPHELSGGQCQRVAIARALAVNPSLIVCDEAVSALDVSIRAQVVNLLEDLQERFTLGYLFISHDMAVVRHISDRVAVMYLGKIVELAECDDLYARPLHPYTRALLSAVPVPDPKIERKRQKVILAGDIPSAANPPSGCRFHTRCAFATDHCRNVEPPLVEVESGRRVACHYWKDIPT